MHPLDRHIHALRARGPVPAPPALPAGLGWRRWAAGAALAAGTLLAVGALGEGAVRERGDGGPAAAALDLRVVVVRDGHAMRLADGGQAHVGEQVYFRARAADRRRLRLTVTGPALWQPIAEVDAGPEGVDVPGGSGLLAWEFTTPGDHVFTLADPGTGASSTLAVEVR